MADVSEVNAAKSGQLINTDRGSAQLRIYVSDIDTVSAMISMI